MALSRIEGLGQDNLYVGGIWALRRSDSLTDRRITHVLSMVQFDPSSMKNFKDESWSHYGRGFEHLMIDIDDVDDADMLIELPRAVRFIDKGLRTSQSQASAPPTDRPSELGAVAAASEQEKSKSEQQQQQDQDQEQSGTGGGVFIHCAAGKSRSVTATIAYLLWRYPDRFDPSSSGRSNSGDHLDAAGTPTATPSTPGSTRSRRETAPEAVSAALELIRRSRPMADPNDGFISQLQLWWEMGCPVDTDIETHPIYQRWAYKREIDESLAVGQAPSRLRFEDEEQGALSTEAGGTSLRCKKCRRTLATGSYIKEHQSPGTSRSTGPCPHFFIEPMSWMRSELEKGELNGRLQCPSEKCGAGVGRYDWRGFKCSCDSWVAPAFSLQRARVDDIVLRKTLGTGSDHVARQQSLGIRMPPGARNGNL